MAPRLLIAAALAAVLAATVAGAVRAQVGDVPLDQPGDVVDQTGDALDQTGVDVDPEGGVGVDLPGGGGVNVGGEGGANVGLPGGGGAQIPGGEQPPETDPANPAPAPAPAPAPGGGGGAGGGGDGLVGPGGGGGRGEGAREGRGDGDDGRGRVAELVPTAPPRLPDGTPTAANPGVTIADFGPAPLGVPNFVINSFSIPPFLLPIYQACGTQYGVPWQVLASINRIETAFGTNLNVSYAGAVGWMQFLPSTWEAYGVDANNDGRKDPYNPVDAICAAARYLRASGAQTDLGAAIFAYNHADWYVDEVLLYARQYGRLPVDLVGSLTGLTEGARFPVAADSRYADDVAERKATDHGDPSLSSPTRRGINVYADEGAPIIAVNDGVIRDVGRSKRLGNYVVLQDAYGNRYTYARMGRIARLHPVPRRRGPTADDYALVSPRYRTETEARSEPDAGGGPTNTEDLRERLYARPDRPNNVELAELTGQLDPKLFGHFPDFERFRAYTSGILKFNRKTMELRELDEGSKVVAGTLLGRVGKTDDLAPHLNFAIRPAGRGAPRINPKPILDGWKLLEATALYRAVGRDPFAERSASIGQILLMPKDALARRALADPNLEIYGCGRQDIATGQIDRRVLALLEYLTASGFRLAVTSLKCGHSIYTSSGGISHHSTGSAVDIAEINGLPVLGNQGPGSITEGLIRQILNLQGTMLPDQVISLMSLGGPTFAMSDHADHVHVGYAPAYGPPAVNGGPPQLAQVLQADQWERLIGRIAEIDNPRVRARASKFALPVRTERHGKGAASHAHRGE